MIDRLLSHDISDSEALDLVEREISALTAQLYDIQRKLLYNRVLADKIKDGWNKDVLKEAGIK